METLLKYMGDGFNFSDFLIVIIIIVAVVSYSEKVILWVCKYFNHLYKKKKGQEDTSLSIDANATDIKKLQESIENLTILFDSKYNLLNQKIDEQQKRLDLIDQSGKNRDCAILRDRLLGGIRYFRGNKDNDGMVHIAFVDHENMEHLFAEYFNCSGNGTVKTIYDNEFKNWIIDK